VGKAGESWARTGHSLDVRPDPGDMLRQIGVLDQHYSAPDTRRQIVGVYVGWRGLSLQGGNMWENLSFWTRKRRQRVWLSAPAESYWLGCVTFKPTKTSNISVGTSVPPCTGLQKAGNKPVQLQMVVAVSRSPCAQ
jgi:hypothetical protein